MELPDAVFVDTSVLRGNHYNFASTQISSFVAVAKAKGLKLLLPRPTSDEIERHIWEGAKETVEQLRSLFKKSPSLKKWNVWSEALISEHAESALGRVAMEEWYEFLKSFSVARLAYDGISIERVMEWYRWGFAPFGKGAKRKEFPDAFAIASLALYANKEGANVAVVAHDQDFKRACAREPRLLHFSSLPELTQLLLSETEEISSFVEALERNEDTITLAIVEEVKESSLRHADERVSVIGYDVEDVNLLDLSVLAVGENECTFAFGAKVRCAVDCEWDEIEDYGDDVRYVTERGLVFEHLEVTGIAKLLLSPDGAEDDITALRSDEDRYVIRNDPQRC